MSTMQQTAAETEIWLNTAPGGRWYKVLDLYGREATRMAAGGKTFTLTVFERQLNQAAAASAEQDLFRNGTFELRKASEHTNEEEVRSPNALTEIEVTGIAMELMHGIQKPETVLAGITSEVTFNRIIEALVLEDAGSDLIAQVKALKKGDEEPPKKVETPVATMPSEAPKAPSAPPKPEPVMTTPDSDEDEEDEFDKAPGVPVTAELKDNS